VPSFDDLIAEVDRAFAVTGAATPGWPDPHPHGARPLDDEYSRVSDQGKYGILQTRLDAWAEVLTAHGVARVEVDGLVRRLVPTRPGGLVLILETTIVDGAPYGVEVRVGDGHGDPAFLDRLPYCGCDACDDGSDVLLENLDGQVLTVLQGGVVRAEIGERAMTRSRDGWHGTGASVSPLWLDETWTPPDEMRRWVGAPWR
jgi:hypothetical protein